MATIPLIDQPTNPGKYGWRARPQNRWRLLYVYQHKAPDELRVEQGGSVPTTLDQLAYGQWCGPVDLPPREQ